jgi:cleavage and polyadenylation specificity factor subunit 2
MTAMETDDGAPAATDAAFTPLYGARGAGPAAGLLRVGGATLLLDCGWGPPWDEALLAPLRAALPSVDAVLISHPDAAHMGALPLLVGRLGLGAPVFSTGAAHKMGQMALYDAYLAARAFSDFEAWDLDDVDAAFARLTQLRYRQEAPLSGKAAGVRVTPLPAGRLVGGALWRVAAGGEEFVYAVDWNHRRERHLAGAPLGAAFHRPALLVADAAAPPAAPAPGAAAAPADRARAEAALVDACLAALRADGNVLIPVDAAGRVLELVLVLERAWGEGRYSYPVAFVGPMARTTLEFAQSSLEWMNEALARAFGSSKDNPFALRHVKALANLKELSRLPPGPRVVLATTASLEGGAARTLFAEWAPDPRTLVVLALAPAEGSLGAEVAAVAAARDAGPPGAPPPVLTVTLGRRVPLAPEELEARRAEEARAAHAVAEAAAAAAAAAGGDAAAAPAAAATGTVAGGSPAGKGRRAAAPQPTRANTAEIGHLARGAAGRAEVVAADGAPLAPGEAPEGDGAGGGGAGGADAEMAEADADDAAGGGGGVLLEGFEPPSGAAAPMFPDEDAWEALEWDEYGARLDLAPVEGGAGGRLGRALASEAAAERGGGGGGGAAAAGPAEPAEEPAPEEEAPTKAVVEERQVPLAARVLRLDWDGRADARSAAALLAAVAPRAAALVRGTASAAAALAERLSRELEGLHAAVHVAEDGVEILVPGEPAFEVALAEGVGAAAAEAAGAGGYALEWVDAVVGPPDAGGDNASADGPAASAVAAPAGAAGAAAAPAGPPTLLPARAGAAARHAGVFIGDVRLSELRGALAVAGVASEFHGGALHCEGRVVVRRAPGGGGGLLLEGAPGAGYHRVRGVVYAQFRVA